MSRFILPSVLWVSADGGPEATRPDTTPVRAYELRLAIQSSIAGQVPAPAGKAQVLPQRKTTLVVITRTSYRKETGTQDVASLDRGIGAGWFPEALRPEGQHRESGIAVSVGIYIDR